MSFIFTGQTAGAIDASRLPQTQGPSHIPLGERVVPPFAYMMYCVEGYNCRPVPAAEGFAPTARRMAELNRVNQRVNRAIAYRPDNARDGRADRWEARVRQGDCEDYALTKRQELIELGWPSNRLLITLAVTADGVGHAAVIVRLEDRDVVLDSLTDRILPWQDTSHRYLKVQSPTDPLEWYAVRPRLPA